jgi:alkylation response protein AidB-like acyl-CoA dehydrogenase
MANTLALAPIQERGTEEQRKTYMSRCIPPQAGDKRKICRGAFALTEPIPYVGVDTGVVGGKVRIAEWKAGQEPMLHVEKRGRFITNMAFANFVTAAVDSADEHIKGSCMIILEEEDPGTFDRGTPTRKLAHQLSSTRDPIFSLKVPASRIIGGYSIKDGVIIPNYSHSEIIESVFTRTRVTPSIMTSAKLLSAVEPIIRYHRRRFRGGGGITAGTPRYELGLQQKEDVLHRLVDIWTTGEAGASLGFATARLLDVFEPVEKEKDRLFAEQQIKGRAQLKAFRSREKSAAEYIALSAKTALTPDEKKRIQELESDPLLKYMSIESQTSVMIPACKLWNTGHGVNMMREAVSLMGGYGITEDCPGFLATKWIDGQLEATYEGPEVVQRRQLSFTMTSEIFLVHFRLWINQMREIATEYPGTGACVLASAMELWIWSLQYLLTAKDIEGKDLYQSQRHGVTFPMADAFCWILASRFQILDTLELIKKGPENPALSEGLPGFVSFFSDLCHVHAARSAGEVARVCAELLFGYNRHPAWGDETCSACDKPTEKAGPCVKAHGLEPFFMLRTKLDGCLTGSRIAKDRAAAALTRVMIPEALDYPA